MPDDKKALDDKKKETQVARGQNDAEAKKLVAVDEIEAKRDAAKIEAGVVPAPHGSEAFEKAHEKALEELQKKTNDSVAKFDKQQKDAKFPEAGAKPKAVEAQAGDSPKTVDSPTPQPSGGGPAAAPAAPATPNAAPVPAPVANPATPAPAPAPAS